MELSFIETMLVAGAGATVTAIATALFSRKLNEAKVKSIISDTYDKLINTLSSQVDTLQERVDRLTERLDHLTKKELEYLATITELTRERNFLQEELSRKQGIIDNLKKS